MKISEKKVFALTNPNGDVPPSTKLIVKTIAAWLDTVLPWVRMARRSGVDSIDFRILKINTGRQLGHTFALKAIADLYADDMVALFYNNRIIKYQEFNKIPKLKAYSMFSLKNMFDDESLKDRILFCDVPIEYIPKHTWHKLRQFGFKAIIVIG